MNLHTCEICNSKRGYVIKCGIINCSAKFHYICARLRNENNKHKNINKVNFFIKNR